MRWCVSPMLCLFAGICLIGCSKSKPAVQAESFDPDAVVKDLMIRCDLNQDGFIESSELESCPALKYSFTFFDKNKDRNIDTEELTNRISAYKGVVVPLGCHVTIAGEPAKGCTITFTPYPALAKFKPASGVTDDAGFAQIKVEDKEGFGVPAGLYTVTITDASGKQIHRATLGREVYDDGRDNRDLIQFSF